MADWTDGPEYAPTERPSAFVEPDAAPLAAAAPGATGAGPGASPLAAAPSFAAPDAPPLDALVPDEAPRRDPEEAFDVASTPMTSWSPRPLPPPTGEPVPLVAPPDAAPGQSAWGHAHAPGIGHQAPPPPHWAPDQPFPPGQPQAPSHVPGPPPTWPPARVNPDGFPQPGTPPWQEPDEQPEFEPVTFGSMLRNTTPGVLVCLVLGALIAPLSVVLVLVASVLAGRIRHRRVIVGRVFSWAIVGSFVLGMATVIGSRGTFDVLGWYEAATGWAQLACLGLLVAIPLVVGDAMRRGEPPEEGL